MFQLKDISRSGRFLAIATRTATLGRVLSSPAYMLVSQSPRSLLAKKTHLLLSCINCQVPTTYLLLLLLGKSWHGSAFLPTHRTRG